MDMPNTQSENDDLKNVNNETDIADNELSLERNIQLKVVKPASMIGRIFRIFLLIILPFGLLIGAVVYKSILDANQPKIVAEKVTEKFATVDILSAQFTDVRPTVTVYGQTIAGKQLNLRTNVGGEVVQISDNFKSGALVNKDELLFSIDPFTYEGALLSAENNYADTLSNIEELKLRAKSEQTNLGTAKEQLAAAEKDYDRGVTLRAQGTITSKALDDKSLVVSQRKQAVDLSENNMRAQINQMKRYETALKNIQYSIDKAKRDVAHTKVYASFDAYVQNASLQIGQLAGTNEQVAILIDRDKMDIVFTLSDSLYGRILAQDGTLIGRKVNLIWQAGSTTRNFTATIDRVAAQITAASGGIELFAHIDNLENIATLRVGSFMTVEIPDRLFENVLRLPEHVVYDGDTIYLLENMAVKIDPEAVDAVDDTAEPKFETRLQPVKVITVGYDGKFALLVNADELSMVKTGDVILQTKLSTAGEGVLVLTRDLAEKQRLERLAKATEDKAQAELDEAETAEKVGD